MIYLAQPYTHPKKKVMKRRYLDGMIAASALFELGEDVYAPIVHWHQAAIHCKLPKDAAFWMKHNFHMLELSEGMAILPLNGWFDSVGLRGEIDHAVKKNVPLFVVQRVREYALHSIDGHKLQRELYDGTHLGESESNTGDFIWTFGG